MHLVVSHDSEKETLKLIRTFTVEGINLNLVFMKQMNDEQLVVMVKIG